eukprot:GHVU01084258.1.p1 GENE.GHVU01084258.1~~GHVU01084258.1.p1  ORF type:complete len:255 (+),score=12.55 GHVU01084258.1:432-1196(+)
MTRRHRISTNTCLGNRCRCTSLRPFLTIPSVEPIVHAPPTHPSSASACEIYGPVAVMDTVALSVSMRVVLLRLAVASTAAAYTHTCMSNPPIHTNSVTPTLCLLYRSKRCTRTVRRPTFLAILAMGSKPTEGVIVVKTTVAVASAVILITQARTEGAEGEALLADTRIIMTMTMAVVVTVMTLVAIASIERRMISMGMAASAVVTLEGYESVVMRRIIIIITISISIRCLGFRANNTGVHDRQERVDGEFMRGE